MGAPLIYRRPIANSTLAKSSLVVLIPSPNLRWCTLTLLLYIPLSSASNIVAFFLILLYLLLSLRTPRLF